MMLKIKKYYFSLIWTAIMFYLLFSPSGSLPKTGLINIPHFDKVVHFGMFCMFAFTYLFDSEKAGIRANKTIIELLIAAIFFAALSELIQLFFIKGRNGSFFDFLADLAGLFCGLVSYFAFVRKMLARFKLGNNRN